MQPPGERLAVFAGWQPHGFGIQRPAKEGGEHCPFWRRESLGEVLTGEGARWKVMGKELEVP